MQLKLSGENDNVVRIMSIHKSKGLEFPVVFLSGLGKQFNLMDLNQNILLHQDLGIGAKYIDYEKQVQYDTLSKAAIRSQLLTETLSEEMRILYVALTRSKEKLILTGIKKDYEKQIEKLKEEMQKYPKVKDKINPILVKKQKRYLDWILLVYFYEENKIKQLVDLVSYHKKEILNFCKEPKKEETVNIKQWEEKKVEKIKRDEIETWLKNTYPFKDATKIPTKTSVSKIKQGREEKKSSIIFPIPKFMQREEDLKLTGAQKGTLLHLCLQKLDENKGYDLEKIQQFITNLIQKEFITLKEGQNIDVSAILKFTESKIWKEMKQAKEIHKEKAFYITIPAKEIYQEEVEENVLVQGIIDLYYITKEEELILVDYKTDFVKTDKELVEKYQQQLELYKRALEEALNRKVDSVYIYSTHFAKEILVFKN